MVTSRSAPPPSSDERPVGGQREELPTADRVAGPPGAATQAAARSRGAAASLAHRSSLTSTSLRCELVVRIRRRAPDTSLPPAHAGRPHPRRSGMAPWVSVPGCRTRSARSRATPDAVCKNYRRPSAAGQGLRPGTCSSSAKWLVELDDGAELLEVDETSRSSRSVPLSPEEARARRAGPWSRRTGRQRRHDQVEAEVVQLARREQRVSARSRPCWRPARRQAAPRRSPRAPRSTPGASTNTASTPTSAAAIRPARSPRRARRRRGHRCGR